MLHPTWSNTGMIELLLTLAACGGPASNPVGPGGAATGQVFVSRDASLSYALDLPAGPGPFPALVVGHGSGRVTKQQGVSIASQLVSRGFAALRYDKRGVGGSTGAFQNVDVGNSEAAISLLASDMIAGVELLKTRSEIDTSRIGLIGGSQAGWIIASAAASSADVGFFVILSGPAVSVGLEIYYDPFAQDPSVGFDELSEILRGYPGPHGYDPLDDLRTIQSPGLWVLGGEDRSVPTRETAAILQNLIDSQGKPYTVIFHPTGTHGLTDVSTGAPLDIWPGIGAWLERFR